MISDYFRLLRQSPKILALGFSFAFFSSFGQTFFISLSVPSITERFGFSNTEWGTLYSGVNVLSALCLPYLGAKLDKTPLRNYARNVALGLGLACGLMAIASNYVLLGLAIFGLRLTGQGLLSLMSTATMARLFHEQRGKALPCYHNSVYRQIRMAPHLGTGRRDLDRHSVSANPFPHRPKNSESQKI